MGEGKGERERKFFISCYSFEQRLDRYFERISEMIEEKKISSRIRFMLQDVQEMRKVQIHKYKIYYLALHVY